MEETHLRGEMQTLRNARAAIQAEMDGAAARGPRDKARLLRLGALAASLGQQAGSLASALKERGVEDATVREAGAFLPGHRALDRKLD